MGSRQRGALSSTLAVVLAGWLATGPAWAGSPTNLVPRVVPAQARPGIAVLIIPLGPQVDAATGHIDFAAREAITGSERLELIRLVDVLDAKRARERESHVEVGEKALARARDAYNELDTLKALEETKKALLAFEQTDLSRHMAELTGAWIMKIASLVANGETRAAQMEIHKLVAIAPEAKFSPQYFPPDEIAFAEKARAAAKQSEGELEVKTTPEGAEVYVDGVFRGISPITVKGLTTGDHYVTVKAPGYALVQQKARPGDVTLSLPQAEAWAQYQEVFQRVVKDPYGAGRDEAARTFAQRLGADQLLLGIVDASPGASRAELTLLRLDARDGHNYAHVQQTVSLDEGLAGKAGELASRTLVSDEARRGGPVTHFRGERGSFFTRKNTGYMLIGAGAALLATGVILGVNANGQAHTFRGMVQTDPGADAVRSRGRTYALVADLSFLAGLAAAGGGSYLAFAPAGGFKFGSGSEKRSEKRSEESRPAPARPRAHSDEDDLREW